MTTIQDTDVDTIPKWQQELDQIGFWRRLLRARRWYGADWWFVVISGLLLIFFFSLALFPGFYAPYDPRAEVGPGLLEPGESPPAIILVGKEAGVSVLDDLIGENVQIGIVPA